MAKSKFSKRQIAGALLLSSTAVGTAASSSASANALTEFFSDTKNKIGKGYDYLANTEFGKYAGQIKNKASYWIGHNAAIAKNKFNELGNKISETEVYKNYISPAKSVVTNFISEHKLAAAIVLTTSAVLFGVYKYIKNTDLVYVKRDAHTKVGELLIYCEENENLQKPILELDIGTKIEKVSDCYTDKTKSLNDFKNAYEALCEAIEKFKNIKFEENRLKTLHESALKSLNKLRDISEKYIKNRQKALDKINFDDAAPPSLGKHLWNWR